MKTCNTENILNLIVEISIIKRLSFYISGHRIRDAHLECGRLWVRAPIWSNQRL